MRKRGLFFGTLLLAFIALSLFLPKPVNWSVTYNPKDENPFGVHALYRLLPGFLNQEKEEIKPLFFSFAEMAKEEYQGNMLVLTQQYAGSRRDVEALFDYVEAGNTVLLAAENIGGYLADSLGLSTGDYAVDKGLEVEPASRSASGTLEMRLRFARIPSYPGYTFLFPAEAARHYLIDKNGQLQPLATNQAEGITWASWPMGKGTLYLSTTPNLLTNYYLLKNKADRYVAGILAPLAEGSGPLYHNQYYQLGRKEAQTPLRYVLSQPALKAAYITMLTALLLFVLFYGKRKQRIIPIWAPLKNSSLEFARTLGQLYYQQRNHKNLMTKRMRYWLSYIHAHYLMENHTLGEAFIEELSQKSGINPEVIRPLVRTADNIERVNTFDEPLLLDLEKRLHEFYNGTPAS